MKRITIDRILGVNDTCMIIETKLSREQIKIDFFNYLVNNHVVYSEEKLNQADEFDNNFTCEESKLCFSASNDCASMMFGSLLQMYCISQEIDTYFLD